MKKFNRFDIFMNGPDKIKILLEEENITKRVMFITKKIKELKV